MYAMIGCINGRGNAIVKMTNGGIAAIEETRRKFNDLHISSQGEARVWKCGEEDYKTSQSIKEIQAIFLEPIPISQDFDNVIHYVKYPKHTQWAGKGSVQRFSERV